MAHRLPEPTARARSNAAGSAPPAAAARVAAPAGTLQITSEQLFAGAPEVQIDHHGVLYRLKKTSLGKLILTK